MKKNDVLEHFGSAAKTARAMRISRTAVSLWPDILSDNVAFKVELVTNGALKTEETLRTLERLHDNK
jgi:hypothetical protein